MKQSTLCQGLLVLTLGLTALPILADEHCKAPMERWQSREAVRQMATQQGWKILRLKIDDGCYEIRGIDLQGRGFKAKIDPETLKIVKMKQTHHHQKDEKKKEREHAKSEDTSAQIEDDAPP